MSKAEDRALEKYPATKSVFDKYEKQRYAYICGYIQAEKDNELTWKDMMVIHKCCKDAMNNHLYEWNTPEGQQKIYKDVLKRFKTQKGEQVDYGKLKTSLDDALSKETKESWEKFLQEEEKNL